MSFQPSFVRQALDELLRLYPFFDLVSIDWQIEGGEDLTSLDRLHTVRERVSLQREHTGPWVIVQLGQPSESFHEVPAWAIHHFAIWKTTGALHTMEPPGGPVSDEPIWVPAAAPPEEQA